MISKGIHFMHGNQWNRWLVLATACSACALAQAQDARPIPGTIELNSTPTLTVAGRGEVFATPDRAIVRLGAEAQAPEATDAQAKVNENMTKALAEIRKVGVEQNAIQTMGLNLFPVYS